MSRPKSSRDFDSLFGVAKDEPMEPTSEPSIMLRGAEEIAEFLHIKCHRRRRPVKQTISTWRKADDFPAQTKPNGEMCVDSEALRLWALKHGKIPPQNAEDKSAVKFGNINVPPPSMQILHEIREHNGDLDTLLDMAVFDDYPDPTGDIEDELREARKLRHYFGRIVFSWRLEKLGNPKMLKVFQDFASGLTRQIAVISRIEESITKQRIRNGKLLDEITVIEWSRALAAFVVAEFSQLSRDIFDIVDEEIGRRSVELGIEFSINSDRALKLFNRRFMTEREKIAIHSEELLAQFQANQIDRKGGEEDDQEDENEEPII